MMDCTTPLPDRRQRVCPRQVRHVLRTSLAATLVFSCWLPVHAQQAEADLLLAEAILQYQANKEDTSQVQHVLSIVEQALMLVPTHARGLYYKGLLLLALNEPEKAKEALENAKSQRPEDPSIRYQLGLACLRLTNSEKQASEEFEHAFARDPHLPDLFYYVGHTRFEQKRYADAWNAFSAGTTDNKEIQGLTNLYKFLSSELSGFTTEAQVELTQIPSFGELASQSGKIDTLLNTFRDTRDQLTSLKRHLRATINIGGFYDDNVLANPNPSADAIAQLLRTRKTTSSGIMVSGLADYSFFRKGPIEASASYAFFQTLNLNHGLSAFNLQDHQVGLSTSYRGALARRFAYQFGFQYGYDYLFLDQTGFLSRHVWALSPKIGTPGLSLPWVGNLATTTSLVLRYQINNFLGEVGDHDLRFRSDLRDGYNTAVGFAHLFRFADDTVIFTLGYHYDSENTAGQSFSYRGNRFSAGTQIQLPWQGIQLRYDYDVHWRAYIHPQAIFRNEAGTFSQRYDLQQTHLFQARKPIGEHFSVSIQFQHIRNDSRIPVFDFTKSVITSMISWHY